MWEKIKMCLGKVVQAVLNIFRKKKSYTGKQVNSSSGELYIDGMSFGKIDLSQSFEKTDEPAKLLYDLAWGKEPIGKEPIVLEFQMDEDSSDLLKKLTNTHEQVLPKVIEVPTLIVSTYASWEYDSIGVDFSQLEEKGIAHYFCTSVQSMQENMEEFRKRYPDNEALEWEEDREIVSIIIKDAILLNLGGHWIWY